MCWGKCVRKTVDVNSKVLLKYKYYHIYMILLTYYMPSSRTVNFPENLRVKVTPVQ